MKTYLKLNNEVLNEYASTGQLNLEKDKEATRQYFHESVNKRMRGYIDLADKLKYLTENNYYEKEIFQKYSEAFIHKIFDIAYKYKYRFPSFMSASKFYENYALKSRDNKEILERYEDRCSITALYLSDGDELLAERAIHAIMQAGQPATPTFLNSGKKARGELVSCFKLTMDDSMNSIGENILYCLELSRLGGGVGVNLTDLRPMGDPIKGIENSASGVLPVAKLLENSFSYSNQLGQRDGSGVVWINIFHGDIENFISSKKPNADEKIRLVTLSTGIVIPDIFFELMKKDKDIVLFSPYDIYKEYGIRMSEMNLTEMYYELLDNKNIRKLKRLNARKLYTQIKQAQFESGYPFEMFDDNTNKAHPLKGLGRVKMSNLCSEILQFQKTSIITDRDQENEYGYDVSCNLASLDIHKATKVDDFAELVDTMMRLLTSVSDKTNIVNVPSVAKANKVMHSVGLGTMNMHGHLVTQGIMYGSPEAIQFTDLFFEALNFFSLKSSMELAKERKESFYGFEKSNYANGSFFEKYVSKEMPILLNGVKEALGNIPIITAEDWRKLKEDVATYGVYNAYRLAVAPTGSVSYIRNCTASISPITELVETRDYGNSRTIYPMPYLNDETKHLYVTAYDMNMYRMVDMYAAAQQHVDQGISMTLFVKDSWTTADLAKVYAYAHYKQIKTVYYVRQKLHTIEECVACQI